MEIIHTIDCVDGSPGRTTEPSSPSTRRSIRSTWLEPLPVTPINGPEAVLNPTIMVPNTTIMVPNPYIMQAMTNNCVIRLTTHYSFLVTHHCRMARWPFLPLPLPFLYYAAAANTFAGLDTWTF